MSVLQSLSERVLPATLFSDSDRRRRAWIAHWGAVVASGCEAIACLVQLVKGGLNSSSALQLMSLALCAAVVPLLRRYQGASLVINLLGLSLAARPSKRGRRLVWRRGYDGLT